MRTVVASIESEFRRYKRTGEGVMDQLGADQLRARPTEESNSIATIVWHVSGNLESRFTDFLTSDGEKPWRERDDEFAVRDAQPDEIRAKWERGWMVLLDTLSGLEDGDLTHTITIRRVELTVLEALHRALAHTASHVGQMAYLGKQLSGERWVYLSIPPGGTAAYNENPRLEKSPS